jgi:nickel-type superoxide dismutase maturation protease
MTAPRGRRRRPLLVVLAGLGAALFGAAFAARWLDAVEVIGESMTPSLVPGDRLLVEALTFTRRAPRIGELVLAADPREPGRELVKRVTAIEPNGDLVVRGDAAEWSTDSREFGPLPGGSVRWRVLVRYAPLRRFGRP